MLRLMQSIKGWERWEIYDWPFIRLVSGVIIISTLSWVTASDALLVDVLFIATGLFGSFVLLRMTKTHLYRIWQSAAGKVALAFFSLIVIAAARILAD